MNAEATTPGKGLKITMIILRTLMGLLFLFASITYFMMTLAPHSYVAQHMTQPPTTGAVKTFNDGIEAARYLMPTVKVFELLCGLAFVTGRFVPLAAVLIAPIIINIVAFHAFLEPAQLPIAIFLVIANGVVAYYHRDRYAPLFRAK